MLVSITKYAFSYSDEHPHLNSINWLYKFSPCLFNIAEWNYVSENLKVCAYIHNFLLLSFRYILDNISNRAPIVNSLIFDLETEQLR